jgi:hypothetical protein
MNLEQNGSFKEREMCMATNGIEPTDPSRLMHEMMNHVSSIMSIAQFALISKEMSTELKADMERIIQNTRQVTACIRHLAEVLEEE